jgi:endonuclease/exonuclease/phosphatase family metal-dependent hydrolase
MTEGRIRVATYNVHKCRGLDQKTSPSRIAEVIRELDADVVAIQEIVRGSGPKNDQVEQVVAEAGDRYEVVFGENRTHRGSPYGNVTLSRIPIIFSQNYDVTWRRRERRGCLRTDVQLAPGSVVHIFNVHLGTGFIERRGQARRLLSVDVLGRGDLSGPRIVVGDFNEWTKGLASRLMEDSFKAVELRAYMKYARTYPGVMPFLHLDHFYYDEHLRLESFKLHRSRRALLASDHLPLVAQFLANS